MRFLLTLSLLFLFTAPNLAAAKPRVDRIEVVSAGLFKSKVAKKVARSAASFTNPITSITTGRWYRAPGPSSFGTMGAS